MTRGKWYSVLCNGLVLLITCSVIACRPLPSSAPLTQSVDTTPPPAITGLAVTDAYNGNANLSWDRNIDGDLDHYNVYVSEVDIKDISGKTPVHQITDIVTSTYQVSGLEEGKTYYFAVTAVDNSGNEFTVTDCVSTTVISVQRGVSDPDICADICRPDALWAGTTLLADNHNPQRPRIIEVNVIGEVIWEYLVPDKWRQYTNPGFDVELLPNDNILFVLPRKGVFEIDRSGKINWSYLDKKVSHDADRLPNGNTLVVWGGGDMVSDAQVKEINPKGDIVWAWYAKDHFYKPPYKDIRDQGWTHTNAVSRMQNGNTLISPRNFNLMVEVSSQGSVVRTIGEGVFYSQHDPVVLPDGNILAVSQWRTQPHRAIEIDPDTGKIVWEFSMPERRTWPVRDADRLPNGNTLITGSTKIVEVTTDGELVWQLRLKTMIEKGKAPMLGFYKAERIGIRR